MENLTNHVYGSWSVLGEHKKQGHNELWLCRCVCGKERFIPQSSLKNGRSKSCGCQRHNRRIHGLADTRLYNIWRTMKDRCYLLTCKEYPRYGARGISVCPEWKDNFLSFYFWSINEGYDETAERGKFTLDRIDNDGNYEPSNCRWIDEKQQARNRRNTIWIEHNGEKKSLPEWCEIIGFPYQKAIQRYRHGKSKTFEYIFR